MSLKCLKPLLRGYFQFCSTSTPEYGGEKPRFPGAMNCEFTEKLGFVDPSDPQGIIPVYRVMDRHGTVIDEAHDPKVIKHR